MAAPPPAKSTKIIDSVEAAEAAVQELRDTHDGILAMDLEGELGATARLSLSMPFHTHPISRAFSQKLCGCNRPCDYLCPFFALKCMNQ